MITHDDNVEVNGALDINGADGNAIQLQVKGAANQAEALQTWEDNGGTALAQLTSNGRLEVGDPNLIAADALIEANKAITEPSTAPHRGLQTQGHITVDAPATIQDNVRWSVHELTLSGDAVLDQDHSALRSQITRDNTSASPDAKLLAGDFAAINNADSGSNDIGQMIGIRSAVTNEDGASITNAVGADIQITDDNALGQIENAYGVRIGDMPDITGENYAIYTGDGPVRFGDSIEMEEQAIPADPPVGSRKLYPKSDGLWYSKGNGEEETKIGTGNNPGLCQGRLTLVSGTPVPMGPAASENVYFTPYLGNQVNLYDGSVWKQYSFTELSLSLAELQNGTLTNGNATVTGLADTSLLAVGAVVSGTGIPANTTIVSIDSAIQITLSQDASASGPSELTFKRISTNVDIFIYRQGTTTQLEKQWWSGNTRITDLAPPLDGVYVQDGAPTKRYLGTVRTNLQGKAIDNLQWRFVFNEQNRVPRQLRKLIGPTGTLDWSYTVNQDDGWHSANYNDLNRVALIVGRADVKVDLRLVVRASGSGSGITHGIAYDATNTNHADLYTSLANDGHLTAEINHYPEIGFRAYQWVENAHNNACTVYGYAADVYQSGMVGEVML